MHQFRVLVLPRILIGRAAIPPAGGHELDVHACLGDASPGIHVPPLCDHLARFRGRTYSRRINGASPPSNEGFCRGFPGFGVRRGRDVPTPPSPNTRIATAPASARCEEPTPATARLSTVREVFCPAIRAPASYRVAALAGPSVARSDLCVLKRPDGISVGAGSRQSQGLGGLRRVPGAPKTFCPAPRAARRHARHADTSHAAQAQTTPPVADSTAFSLAEAPSVVASPGTGCAFVALRASEIREPALAPSRRRRW
jgi:hypothetical protein